MNVLFVCTGNTCRSCMAEAIFNKLNTTEKHKAFSAGLRVIEGSITSKNSASVAMEFLNVNIGERKAVQLSEDMIKGADIVLTMTAYMAMIIKSEFKQSAIKVFPIKEYVSLQGDVADPYGGDLQLYKATYKELRESIELLVKRI